MNEAIRASLGTKLVIDEVVILQEIISIFLLPAILTFVAGYLLGSLEFSIIITKLYGKGDIRKYGSGNAGMTNVLRAVGKLPALLTFVLDFLKCAVAVMIGYFLFLKAAEGSSLAIEASEAAFFGKYVGGLGALLGTLFPLYYQFKGGKGVVTCCALIALMDWRVFVPAILLFIVIFIVKRIVSLASIISFFAYPFICFAVTFLFDCEMSPLSISGDKSLGYVLAVTLCAAALSVIVIILHIPNIKRLLNGEEKPIQAAPKASTKENA